MAHRDQVLDAYNRAITKIETNRVYDAHAKRVMTAKEYQQAQNVLDELRQAEVDSIDARRSQLQRRMFGHQGAADAQTVIARRDANDRVAKLENPSEAAEHLRRAQMEGDTLMAQAIALRATQYGWNDALSTYASDRPDFRGAAAEYNELPDTNNVKWKISHASQFRAATPHSLMHARPEEIERLAQQNIDEQDGVA